MKNELPFKDGHYIDSEGNSNEIGRVAVSSEYRDGVIRLVDVVGYDINDCELFNDSNLIDNSEFQFGDEILETLSKRYGISSELIENV